MVQRRSIGGGREGGSMAKKQVLPRVHVLVLCDEVEHRPDEEDVFDLRGVRSEIVADGFPYTHPRLAVYLQVTGHERTAACRIAVVRAETDEEEFVVGEDAIQLRGPLEFLHFERGIEDGVFPAPGIYYVQVFFDGVLCGERALALLRVEGGRNGQAG
jgi:hypothetical protein